MENKTAIILGGTVPHAEVIYKLKNRGYHTILIDYLENPVAREAADEHIRESTLDKEAVLKIAQDRHADLVISAAVDQANISACYAMEKMGLYVPYSYETACNITNKGFMKKHMLENGIPTSSYISVDNTYKMDEIDVAFPVMVKPADSNSANGVKCANDKNELCKYLEEAVLVSRNHKAVIEGVMKGREISAYCYIIDGRAKLLMTAERLSVVDGDVIKCYATIAPARISTTAERKAEDIATQIAQVFGLDNTPLFFQGMVQGDNIEVIEFAPRVAGGLSFRTICDNTGFDILDAMLDSYTGGKASLNGYHAPKWIYVINTVYGTNGVFNCLIGMNELIKQGLVEQNFMHKTAGMVLNESSASSSRISGFIVKAKTFEEAKIKVEEVYRCIDALDVDGNSIIRNDFNIAVQL